MAVNYDLTDPFHWFKSSDILFTKLREIEASPSVLDEPGSFTRMDLSKMETVSEMHVNLLITMTNQLSLLMAEVPPQMLNSLVPLSLPWLDACISCEL